MKMFSLLLFAPDETFPLDTDRISDIESEIPASYTHSDGLESRAGGIWHSIEAER